MLRRLFTPLSTVLILLCIAVGSLWVRSYWVFDAVDWATPRGRAGVFSVRARVGLGE